MLEMLFNRWRGTGTIFWKIQYMLFIWLYWVTIWCTLYSSESFGYMSSEDRKYIDMNVYYNSDYEKSFPL